MSDSDIEVVIEVEDNEVPEIPRRPSKQRAPQPSPSVLQQHNTNRNTTASHASSRRPASIHHDNLEGRLRFERLQREGSSSPSCPPRPAAAPKPAPPRPSPAATAAQKRAAAATLSPDAVKKPKSNQRASDDRARDRERPAPAPAPAPVPAPAPAPARPPGFVPNAAAKFTAASGRAFVNPASARGHDYVPAARPPSAAAGAAAAARLRLAELLDQEKNAGQRLKREQTARDIHNRIPPAVHAAMNERAARKAEEERRKNAPPPPPPPTFEEQEEAAYAGYMDWEEESRRAEAARRGFDSFAERWRQKNAKANAHTPPPPQQPPPPRLAPVIPTSAPVIDPFLFATPPQDFESCSTADLKRFLSQAGVPPAATRAVTEKADLAQLAKASMSLWEIARVLQCSRSLPDATRRAQAVLRLDAASARDARAAKKAFLKLSLLIHPDKAGVATEGATEAFTIAQKALETIQTQA